jgi:ribonuclease HI
MKILASYRAYTDASVRGYRSAQSGAGRRAGLGIVWYDRDRSNDPKSQFSVPVHVDRRSLPDVNHSEMGAIFAAAAMAPAVDAVDVFTDSMVAIHAMRRFRRPSVDGRDRISVDSHGDRCAVLSAATHRMFRIGHKRVARIHHVKGHRGDVGNCTADELAGRASKLFLPCSAFVLPHDFIIAARAAKEWLPYNKEMDVCALLSALTLEDCIAADADSGSVKWAEKRMQRALSHLRASVWEEDSYERVGNYLSATLHRLSERRFPHVRVEKELSI